jgi:hypothetical protein
MTLGVACFFAARLATKKKSRTGTHQKNTKLQLALILNFWLLMKGHKQ